MFDPAAYGPVFARLLQTVDRCRPLMPFDSSLATSVPQADLTTEAAFAHAKVFDGEMAALCLAGVWLLYDGLDQSHQISQSIETADGSYWHGIMHRLEPDYANAKYWFRRVGRHPVFTRLSENAPRLVAGAPASPAQRRLAAKSSWDPLLFVDLCEAATRSGGPDEALCRQVAACEWELLFDHCYHEAVRQSTT